MGISLEQIHGHARQDKLAANPLSASSRTSAQKDAMAQKQARAGNLPKANLTVCSVLKPASRQFAQITGKETGRFSRFQQTILADNRCARRDAPTRLMAQHSRRFVFYKENWAILSQLKTFECTGRGWMARTRTR